MIALLISMMVVNFADRQVVVAAFPYLRDEWGLSEAQLGALVSAVSVTIALTALPLALVVDRWSRVRAVSIMAVWWSAATAASAAAPGYAALLAARVAVGAGEAGFGPAGAALLAARFPADRRATVLAAFQAGGPVGLVVGAVVGSLVAAQWGWRAAFLVMAVPGFALALMFLRVRDYPNPPSTQAGACTAAVALARARSARGAMLGGALLLVVVSTLYAWLPTYLQFAYRMPPAPAGLLAAVAMLAAATGSVSAGAVADSLGRRDVRLRLVVPAVAALATATSLGSAFAAVPPGAAQLVLILAGAATATAAVGPVATVVIDVVEPGLRATATALYVVVQNLFGLAVGPVLTGALADRWGLSIALTAVSGLGVVAAAALWWASGFYARERNAPASASPAEHGSVSGVDGACEGSRDRTPPAPAAPRPNEPVGDGSRIERE